MKKSARRIAVLAFTLLFAGTVCTVTALADQSFEQPLTTTIENTEENSNTSDSNMNSESQPSQPDPETSNPSEPSSPSGSDSPDEEPSGSIPVSNVPSSSSQVNTSNPDNPNPNDDNNDNYNPDNDDNPGFTDTPDLSIPNQVTNPDTQAGMVNSRAEGLDNTDPDEQSNTDWSDLLNSGSSETSEDSALETSEATSSQGQKASSGGITWMLIVGILCILLALGGIGYFIYAQFFAGRGGPHNKGGGPSGGSGGSEDETGFIDISSSSDGLQHRDGYIPPEENASPKPDTQSVSLDDRTMEIPSLSDEKSTEELWSSGPDLSGSSAQQKPLNADTRATQTDNHQKNFDWNKFFEENNNF